MPTPLFTLRLPADVLGRVSDIAKKTGAPNTRRFIADYLTALSTRDPDQVALFIGRVWMKLNIPSQLTLGLTVPQAPTLRAGVARSGRRARKEGRKRGRRT
jgi:hypothetical protein